MEVKLKVATSASSKFIHVSHLRHSKKHVMQSLRFSEILPVVVDSSFKSKFGQRLGNEKCTKNTEDRNKCSALIVTESRQEKNDSRSGKTEKESANIGNEENVIEMEKKGA